MNDAVTESPGADQGESEEGHEGDRRLLALEGVQ